MTTFTETFACTSRAHCGTCRVDAAWRSNVGAPDVCPHPSRGLGDTVAKIIKAVSRWVARKILRRKRSNGITPCGGCKKRQTKLNELVPYGAEGV